MKLNLRKKLQEKKGKPVNGFFYKTLYNVVLKPFLLRPMNVSVIDNVNVKKLKGPFIVVSNHTSRCDYIYVSRALYPHKINYVASYTEFHRKHLHGIFSIARVIPKKNFVSDIHAIKEVLQVVKAGGNVALFPEGKSSISGTNQPCMIGTGKLFKHCNLPVISTTIRGGYMSNTQWNIKNRPGKVEVEVNLLFSAEDTQKLTTYELEERFNQATYQDDFEWNRERRIKYKGNDTVANKLEEHLFLCPKCGKELTMHGDKNVFSCTACGNGARINEYYDLIPLDETCVIPKTLRVWYELQRRKVYREIKSNPNFTMTEKVKLGFLPVDHYIDKEHTSEIHGEGTLTLTREFLSFDGTVDGKPYSFNQSVLNVPSLMLETDSSYFGAFIDGEYHEFHPQTKITTKWVLAAEECHRLAGGKWQNTLKEQQWIYEDDKPTDKENYYL